MVFRFTFVLLLKDRSPVIKSSLSKGKTRHPFFGPTLLRRDCRAVDGIGDGVRGS